MKNFTCYLEQLERHAYSMNVPLKDACLNAGIPDSTYYRWINKTTTPSDRVARLVYDQITHLAC